MIRVVAKIFIKPQDKEALLESLQELIEKSRKEKGCRFYDLMQSSKDPSTLCFIEEWESYEALDLHTKTPHFISGNEALQKFLTKEAEMEIFEEI